MATLRSRRRVRLPEPVPDAVGGRDAEVSAPNAAQGKASDPVPWLGVRGLHKSFPSGGRSVAALRDVSLEVEPGEFMAVIGKSGSGKTTLLRAIAGLEDPDAGEVWVRGKPVFSGATRTKAPPQARQIGMVFQSYAIWPHLSVLGNVMLPLLHGHRRLSRQEAHDEALKALGLVGMRDLADRPAPQVSGGQQQRIALARAIAVSAGVLLMDEPLSNLDARLREEVRSELKALVARLATTVIYVTHDHAEALALGDRVALMDHGTIVQVGTPHDVYNCPSSPQAADFLGRVNWVEGRAAPGGVIETDIGRFQAGRNEATRTGTVLVGFRPEAVEAGGDDRDANVFTGTVLRVQFLGHRALIDLQAGRRRLVVERPADARLPEGGTLRCFIPPGRLLAFDQDAGLPDSGTGDRLSFAEAVLRGGKRGPSSVE